MARWSKGCVLAVLLAVGALKPGHGHAQNANQGVAIGGNVSGSTISVGLSPKSAESLVQAATTKWKNLTSEQRNELRRLEREIGVTEGALRTFFSILGENDVAADMLPVRLGQIAAQHLALKTQLTVGVGEAPQLAHLKNAARSALDAGLFDQADAALRGIEALQETALDGQLRERIQTAEQRATLAKSRMRFNEAAEQYAVAERYASDDEARSRYQRERARALIEQADEFDDAAAQQRAIALLRTRLPLRDKGVDPEAWSQARRDLGYALIYRGVEKASVAEADEAVKLFDEANGAQKLISNVEYRSEFRQVYGQILCDIGGYRDDSDLLKRGAAVLQHEIDFLRTANDKFGVTVTTMNLSNCIISDKSPDYDIDVLLDMRDMFYNSVGLIDKEKRPFDWSRSTINFAFNNLMIGLKLRSAAYYSESADYFLKALNVLSVASSPRLWNETQLGLSDALTGIYVHSLDVDRLEQALDQLEKLVARRSARPIAERSYLELLLYRTKLDLGYALEDPEAVRTALAGLKASGVTAEMLPDDAKDDLAEAGSAAKSWLAQPLQSPAARDPSGRSTRLGLLQIRLDLTKPAAGAPDARTAAFAEAIKGIRRCRDGRRVANAIGAATTFNEQLRSSDLPPAVREMIAGLKVGNASPLFGEKHKSISSLVLCGREIEAEKK